MTKKDYQVIARAIHEATGDRCSVCDRLFVALSGPSVGCAVHGIRAASSPVTREARTSIVDGLAQVLAGLRE